MSVRIQLETGYLDVKEGTAFPLNFGVADIRDVSKKSGAFSKTSLLLITRVSSSTTPRTRTTKDSDISLTFTNKGRLTR